jgi:hypothetical protein
MIMMARESAASAPLGFEMTGGIDEIMRMMCPMRAINTEVEIVLYRPHFSSAM